MLLGFHPSIQTPQRPTSGVSMTRAIGCDDATLQLDEPNVGATVEQNQAENRKQDQTQLAKP